MEHFKSIEASIIDEKENDPSLARDKNDGITRREVKESNAKLNFTQQAAGGCSKGLFLRRNDVQ